MIVWWNSDTHTHTYTHIFVIKKNVQPSRDVFAVSISYQSRRDHWKDRVDIYYQMVRCKFGYKKKSVRFIFLSYPPIATFFLFWWGRESVPPRKETVVDDSLYPTADEEDFLTFYCINNRYTYMSWIVRERAESISSNLRKLLQPIATTGLFVSLQGRYVYQIYHSNVDQNDLNSHSTGIFLACSVFWTGTDFFLSGVFDGASGSRRLRECRFTIDENWAVESTQQLQHQFRTLRQSHSQF